MKRFLVGLFIVTTVVTAIGCLVWRNDTFMNGYAIAQAQAHLSELTDAQSELEARYLRVALEELEPKAKEAGFVAVTAPRYARQDAVVGYAWPR